MQPLSQPLYVGFKAQNVIKNLQPPWVTYIIKYIFTVGPFSSLSRALARISSRIPAFLCRAAQCRDAFKAEVSLDVGSGSVIRLSKCAGLEKSLYSSMARKTGGCNPEKLFSRNIFLPGRSIKAPLMGYRQKVRPIFNRYSRLEEIYFNRPPAAELGANPLMGYRQSSRPIIG